MPAVAILILILAGQWQIIATALKKMVVKFILDLAWGYTNARLLDACVVAGRKSLEMGERSTAYQSLKI